MKRVIVYLNFKNETEAAFNFYKEVFNSEFEEGIQRYKDIPHDENMWPISEEEQNLIMHVGMPIFEGYLLRGSDILKSMGNILKKGNNVYIHLEVDSRTEVDRLYNALKDGGKIEMELQEQFWGDYFGNVIDKYGIQWMISCLLEK